MENEEHQKVELYIPRKCSVTHRLIESGDKSSIQFNVCILGKDGVMIKDKVKTYAINGKLRHNGLSDHAINRIAQKDGLLFTVLDKTYAF